MLRKIVNFKRFVFVMAAFTITSNLVVLTSTPAKAETEVGCKWSGEICAGDQQREVCLSDGDGNTCTCGAVTRPCD